MAEKLNDIIEKIDEIENSRWRFEDHEKEVAERIQALAFEGELLKNDLYISMPVSIVDPKTKISEPLDVDDVNEYIETGDIEAKYNWVISMWLTIRFDLKKEYVRIYETPYVSFELSPKQNYEIAYTRIKEFITESGKKALTLPHIFELDLKDYEYADEWLSLKKAATWFHKNPSVKSKVNARIKFDKMKFFADMNRRITDDQWEHSAPTQKISIPAYKTIHLDKMTINTLNGTPYENIYFPEQAELRFEKRDDLLNYYWSAIEWVNEHMAGEYQIEFVDKVNESNKWPNYYEDGKVPEIPDYLNKQQWKDIHSGNPPHAHPTTKIQNPQPKTDFIPAADFEFYGFRCTNFNGTPLIEAELWENGHVYTLKNHDKGSPLYYDKVSDGR
jgi:hypothetical protein